MTKKTVTVKGIDIAYKTINQEDYICITDMAKVREGEYPGIVIQNWMRTRNTVDYIGLWEKLYNPNFNYLEFEVIKNDAGTNAFVLTPKRWIEETGAIGFITKQGRYAETLAHKDIAFKFASWLSVEFELYIAKEFQRLKQTEQASLEWTAKRELARINYRIQTDAIKENLIVPTLNDRQISFVYASEADRLNVALFGQTASEWKAKNPEIKGNMRDWANVEQLLVLANLESYNAILIEQGMPPEERIVLLNKTAKRQLETLNTVKIGQDKLLALPKSDKKKKSEDVE